MFNYIVYRVFEFFKKKNSDMALINSINFLSIFQLSLLVPIFLLLRLFVDFDIRIFGDNNNIKFYVGIPLALLIMIINTIFFRKKLKDVDVYTKIYKKYYKEKYILPIWLIFILPILLVFVTPIIFGMINGTLRFPFLD